MWTEEQRAIYRRDESRYPINISLYCHLGAQSLVSGWHLTITPAP